MVVSFPRDASVSRPNAPAAASPFGPGVPSIAKRPSFFSCGAKNLCDCITAEIQGNRIIAHIDSSTFSRDITKQLEATTADGKTTTLTIRFSVPPLLVVSSPRLVWKKGAPAAAQEVRLTIPKGSPVRRLERAELVGKTFDYDPRIVREGREYRIIITPRSTEKAVLERLQIVTDCADYRARRTIYLQIKR